MQNIHDIRHHIRAVEQTRKLTNAMHLISSSRMRKIMPSVDYNHLYLTHIESAMHHILESAENFDLPYLRDRGHAHNTYIVIAGDKGMVGSYNDDLLKFALRYIQTEPDCYLVTLGLMASKFFMKQGLQPDIEIAGASQDPSLTNARHITQDIFQLYDERVVDQVFVVFTDYISPVRQQPVIRRLLPLDVSMFSSMRQREEMIYHPSPTETFRLLVPQYTLSILYGALMKSYASELTARMHAMQSSTRNADELLKTLRNHYNLARQAAITQEITEIMSSAMSNRSEESNDEILF